MFKDVYNLIKEFDKIVIARHIGVDPDALAASCALKNSILLTFPNKSVKVVGASSSRFNYFGKMDKYDTVEEGSLLIVVDTPDTRRIDGALDLTKYKKVIKLDHHPLIEKYADLEYVDPTASSAAQIVLELINESDLLMDKDIAEKLFWGIISDTNRFMFNNSTCKTFFLVGELLKRYDLDINKLYEPLYLRPLSEIRLEGYVASNLTITENKVAYIKITDDLLQRFKTDAASPGNMISNFNYIDEILVWIFITEDVKNENVRISIRSRGPIINSVAEKYNGGGHKYASGARLKNMDDADPLILELDKVCEKYIKELMNKKDSENDED